MRVVSEKRYAPPSLLFQVSIEGTEATHDRIRGKGNFSQTVVAIKINLSY